MRKNRIATILGLVVLFSAVAVVAVITVHAGGEANGAQSFRRHELTSASPSELGAYALGYTRANYRSASGTPAVLLSERVTNRTLTQMGVGPLGFASGEPPLGMVVLRGDFDLHGMPGTERLNPANVQWRVGYLMYVFDLRNGIAVLTYPSYRGGNLRRVLNDPSLPDDSPAVPQEAGNSGPVTLQEAPLPTAPPVDRRGKPAPTLVPPAP